MTASLPFGRTTRDKIMHNSRTKYIIDDNGNKIPYETVIFSRKMYIEPGYEDVNYDLYTYDSHDNPVITECDNLPEHNNVDYKAMSYRRAVKKIFDYSISDTRFDSFVTLTFNREKIDRESYPEIVKTMNVWLGNRVQRHGLIYILVPELHADKKGIHFHGLCNADALRLSDSGHKNNGKTVYNVGDFSLGFSTLVRFDQSGLDRLKVGKYMVKYMTKANGEMIGGRFFLHGGKIRGVCYSYDDVEYTEVEGVEHKLPWNGEMYKVVKHDLTVSGMSNGGESNQE